MTDVMIVFFRKRDRSRGCCGEGDTAHRDAFEPQVLLVDAGCEWKDYASDITRTIPVGNGGKFTEEAGEIYDLVLRMQKVSHLASADNRNVRE
jgi:Xaa-Pro dipeptidase